ncbi:hypothetical protein [Rhodovulum euryhalinum]|uniref:Uncharacterized protein n=1 Tax=Rhodovulum euryhalinum TaxID=35805 RepID=A0A4R2KJ24_9RHOB|nr:hypothetical protein [Rhodovulum euryhalinum]TCO70566.1 hypothetical protein EV655_109113 [Rhodovulum euryhalinum]
MRRNRLILALSACAAALPAGAGPRAVSESLVDCAALVTIPVRAQPAHAAARPGAGVPAVAQSFLRGAVASAAAEGHAAPSDHIAALFERKAALWDGYGMGFTVTEDFRAWMVFCRGLADRQGIDPGR